MKKTTKKNTPRQSEQANKQKNVLFLSDSHTYLSNFNWVALTSWNLHHFTIWASHACLLGYENIAGNKSLLNYSCGQTLTKGKLYSQSIKMTASEPELLMGKKEEISMGSGKF